MFQSNLEKIMNDYGNIKYWESRWSNFWLASRLSFIKRHLREIIYKKEDHILNIGCGNSELGEKMFEDNYKHIYNIYNIDICQNVIECVKIRNENKEGLYFNVMDVRKMRFKDEIFDLVIDKGTMDTILCGENGFLNVVKKTKEISWVLKTGGICINLSFGKPEDRIEHLKREYLIFKFIQ